MLVLITLIKTQFMATMNVIFLLFSAFLSWTNSKLMSSQNKTEICVVSFHISPINPWTSHDKLWTHVKFIPNIKLMKCLWKFKTWWISMFSPTKWVYVEYCPFIVPLLECVHMFIKITQGKNIFMCDSMEHQVSTTWVSHVILWSSHYSWWSNIWWLQCHKKIINNTFPMSWFFLSQWWKNVCIWHFHLLNISTMYINMTYLVLQNFSLSWKDLSN